MQPQSDSTTGVGQELLSDAKDLGSTAANRLHSEVDNRKGEAVTQVKSVSAAIDTAAGELDQNAPQWLKSTFRQGADQVQKFADALEQKDSRQLVDDVSNFARNSPGTFLAVCAAAGFAASRVFRAGAGANSGSSTPTQPGAIGSDFSATPATTGSYSTTNLPTDRPQGQYS